MKPTQLTQDQKDKLLEMTKVLFPECKNIYFDAITIFNTTDESSYLHYSLNNEHIRIHWFEFCLKYLAKKILDNIKNIEKDYIWTFQGRILNINEHPVDYLHNEFLILQKEKM